MCNIVLMLLGQHCTADGPMQCCRMASDNFVLEKILRNVLLILLGQNCAGKNPIQFCSRSPRQLCKRKNSVQCFLNTLGAILLRWKPYAILSKILQTTLYKIRSCAMFNVLLILLEQHCTGKNPMQYCPRGFRQHCIKKFCGILP